jgi:hypothetical protein
VDTQDPRDPNEPDNVWAWVWPRAVIGCLVIPAFIFFLFSLNFAVGSVGVLVAIGWTSYCVRYAFVSSNPNEYSRWYLFWERFGRPFHGF